MTKYYYGMKEMEELKNIYRGRKVLVTGHTGFKGSWLSLWLSQMGAEVLGYSKDIPTSPNHFELLGAPITSVLGNICDRRNLEKTFSEFQPELVIHMAAQSLVRPSYVDPLETYETNIIGTANVLEVCRSLKSLRALLVVTSDKCYENKEIEKGYAESDPLGGYDPYSSSKACAEIVTSSYQRSFFNLEEFKKTHQVLIASARAGNVIGGGDWSKDRLVPDLMRAAEKNEVTEIRSPNAVRPWQHVLEPLYGYLLLSAKLLSGQKEFSGAWNFGPDSEDVCTVGEMVRMSKDIWPRVQAKEIVTEGAPHEAHFLYLNSAKAINKLNWRTPWSVSHRVERTLGWYKYYFETGKVLSANDIKAFESDLGSQAKRVEHAS